MYRLMKIYYDNVTGDILFQCSYDQVKIVDFDHDYETLSILQNYVKESIGLLILENGQYAQDFQEGIVVGVNLDTLTPIFEYPDPENPDEPQPSQPPISEQINTNTEYLVDVDFRLSMVELGLA